MGVGMPQTLLLQDFGEHIRRSFGYTAYWVGSSLSRKNEWRDVDVRLLIPDDEYATLYGDPDRCHQSARWVSTILAWSSFGRTLTGLPIDFQIQPIQWANKKFPGSRGALLNLCEAQINEGVYERGREDAALEAREEPERA